MKEIRKVQTITDRQDASLKIYFKDVSKLPMLTPEQEVELAKKAREGNKRALQQLVEGNLRFVISVAKQYQNKGLPLVDLIQEGSLGLITAAEKYDETRGFRFISFAVWYIRQSIVKALQNQVRTVRLPQSQQLRISKINKVIEQYENSLERAPTLEELEQETNLSTDQLMWSMSAISKSISLETPLGGKEDVSTLMDVIPDDTISETDDLVSSQDVNIGLEHILHKLPYRDSDILRMQFGIGMKPMSIESIAPKFGIGTERVKQITRGAIKYLSTNYQEELKRLL